MDSISECAWFIKWESRSQEWSLIEKPDQILNSLVALILFSLLSQFLDDGVVWVDFHSLFRDHVRSHWGISESLSFHDSFHVGSPSMFTSDENAWRFIDSLRDDNFLYLLTKDIFHQFAERFEFGFFFFSFLLLFFSLFKIESFLGARLEFLAVVLF